MNLVDQLKSLDMRDPGRWPLAIRAVFVGLIFIVCAGVADVISSRVGVPADKGDPLGNMKISSKAKAQAVGRDATALLTACGLALRSFD